MPRYVKISRNGPDARIVGEPSAVLGLPIEPSRPDEARQGVFAEWHWDGRELVVRNDRYGFFPLYYDDRGRDGIVVSDSVETLIALGALSDLDHDALAVFLRLQTFVGEDTPFRQIRQFPPGAELCWSEGVTRLRSERPAVRPVAIARDEAIATYLDLFRQAIGRRLPADPDREVVLPLSGGQDSRQILLELLALGQAPAECVTVARPWSPKLVDDARVAAELTARAGVRHTVLSEPGDLFARELEKNRLVNFSSPDHAWILPFAEYLGRRPGSPLVFDGIAGDILSTGMFLDAHHLALYRAGRLDELADLLLGDETALQAALSPEFARRVSRERALARLVTALRRHVDAPNPLTQFYFWNRTRRAIAVSPYAIVGQVAAVDSPYLDHDLYDFLAALPAEILLDRSFHAETIRAGYPRFADIRFSVSVGRSPRQSGGAPYAVFARRLSRSLLRARPPGRPLIRNGYLIPRLARCVFDPGYAEASAWLLELTLYLDQLNRLAHPGERIGSGPTITPHLANSACGCVV